jgi:hypothetical protein
MCLATKKTTDSSSNSGLSNFRVTVERLLELLDLAESDEYGILKPTVYAFKTAIKFTLEAYNIIGNNFPKAFAGTDGLGSVRLVWQNIKPMREYACFARMMLMREFTFIIKIVINMAQKMLLQWQP